MANTDKLGIPLIEGNQHVTKETVNNALETIDEMCAPATHVASKGHWSGWEAGHNYALQEIIRLPDTPSWGYLECTAAGVSGATIPTNPQVVDGTVVDGGVTWTLRNIKPPAQTGDWCTKQQAMAYAISLG